MKAGDRLHYFEGMWAEKTKKFLEVVSVEGDTAEVKLENTGGNTTCHIEGHNAENKTYYVWFEREAVHMKLYYD